MANTIGIMKECAFVVRYIISKSNGDKASMSEVDEETILSNLRHLIIFSSELNSDNVEDKDILDAIQDGKTFLLGA